MSFDAICGSFGASGNQCGLFGGSTLECMASQVGIQNYSTTDGNTVLRRFVWRILNRTGVEGSDDQLCVYM